MKGKDRHKKKDSKKEGKKGKKRRKGSPLALRRTQGTKQHNLPNAYCANPRGKVYWKCGVGRNNRER